MTDENTHGLEAVINELLDGNPLGDGLSEARLAALLGQDTRARQRYLDWMELHAELLWTHGAAAALFATDQSNEAGSAMPVLALAKRAAIGPFAGWRAVAALAAAVLIVVAVYSLSQNRFKHNSTSDPTLATVEAIEGSVVWDNGSESVRLAAGQNRRLGQGLVTLEGEAASCRVSLAGGAQFVLAGESEAAIALDGANRLMLRRGQLLADLTVQDKANSVVLVTSTARLEGTDTIFTLQARSTLTQVDVERGAVKLRRLVDGAEIDVTPAARAVASLDHRDEMHTAKLELAPRNWRQDYREPPPAECRGLWRPPDENGAGSVRAVPCVAGRRETGEPVVHYGITARSGQPISLATLDADSVLRIRFRLQQPAPLRLMLGLSKPGGGFGGNFQIKFSRNAGEINAAGWRTIAVPIRDLQPLVSHHLAPQPRAQLTLVFLSTFEHDAGLEVAELELVSSEL